MNPIVCPTDFSAPSFAAARYAADMAVVLGARLCLVHVCPLPVTLAEIPLPPYPFDHTVSEAEQMIVELKEQLLCHTREKVEITTEVREGAILDQLKDYCNKIQPYAVVMGAEHAKGMERWIVGASTLEATAELPWPVIVVPDNALFTGIQKIGLACDLKEVADTIPAREITRLVKNFGATLHILHVDPFITSYSAEQVAESALLQEMLFVLNPVYHFMEGQDVEKTIIDFIDANAFDMLFVFPKKHGFFSSLFHHSRSKGMVLQSHIPVAALHEA